EELALRPGVDDRCTKLANIRDRPLDEIDALFVGLREQLPAHVLAQHADADAIQPPRTRKTLVRASGLATDAGHRELVFRVVARIGAEDLRGVLHGSTHGTDSHVETGSHHPVCTDQLPR